VSDLLWIKDWYWAHREVVRVAAAIGGVALVHVALVLWITLRLRELAHMRERMSRLADGLALLTDTTEAGLATLIREVETLGKRGVTKRTAARTSVAKRVAAAAENGDGVARIAETELLSESEVRLHLALTKGATGDGRPATGFAARSPQPAA
jgi:hypothetical protein